MVATELSLPGEWINSNERDRIWSWTFNLSNQNQRITEARWDRQADNYFRLNTMCGRVYYASNWHKSKENC